MVENNGKYVRSVNRPVLGSEGGTEGTKFMNLGFPSKLSLFTGEMSYRQGGRHEERTALLAQWQFYPRKGIPGAKKDFLPICYLARFVLFKSDVQFGVIEYHHILSTKIILGENQQYDVDMLYLDKQQLFAYEVSTIRAIIKNNHVL